MFKWLHYVVRIKCLLIVILTILQKVPAKPYRSNTQNGQAKLTGEKFLYNGQMLSKLCSCMYFTLLVHINNMFHLLYFGQHCYNVLCQYFSSLGKHILTQGITCTGT